jgi:hypothetical protein
LKLTDRDREIIKAVNDFRALRAAHIHALFFGASPSATRSRLMRLFQHGYLDRQFLSLFNGSSAATPPLYTIGKKGAQLLIEAYGYEAADLRIPKKEFSWQFVEHLSKITDFRIAVTLAARAHNWQIETWEDERVFKAATDYVLVTSDGSREQEKPVLPDGYFCLKTDRGRAHFFLEIDRGKEPERSFKPQIEIYEAYVRSGGYQARYSKKSLRILIVTTTERRIHKLKTITEKAGGDGKYLFTAFGQVSTETVLTVPIWQKLGSSQLFSLVPT